MSRITVRTAGAEALESIAALKKQIHDVHVKGRPDLFLPVTDADAFRAFASQEGMLFLLAESEGQLMGYAMIRHIERPATPYMQLRRFTHVEEFCVDERFQRMGAGRALMEEIRRQARAAGCPRIELDVWAFNEGAKQFYEAVGMRPFRYYMEMDTDE